VVLSVEETSTSLSPVDFINACPLGTKVPIYALFAENAVVKVVCTVIFIVLKNSRPLFYSSTGEAVAEAEDPTQAGQETRTLVSAKATAVAGAMYV